MLLSIGDPDKAADFVNAELGAGRKIFGLGHAVYDVDDPRAHILAPMSKAARRTPGEPKWYEMSRRIETAAKELFRKRKGADIPVNVDFYSASLVLLPRHTGRPVHPGLRRRARRGVGRARHRRAVRRRRTQARALSPGVRIRRGLLRPGRVRVRPPERARVTSIPAAGLATAGRASAPPRCWGVRRPVVRAAEPPVATPPPSPPQPFDFVKYSTGLKLTKPGLRHRVMTGSPPVHTRAEPAVSTSGKEHSHQRPRHRRIRVRRIAPLTRPDRARPHGRGPGPPERARPARAPAVPLRGGRHHPARSVAAPRRRGRHRRQSRRAIDLRPLDRGRQSRNPGKPHPDHAQRGRGRARRLPGQAHQRLGGRVFRQPRGGPARGGRARRNGFSGDALGRLGGRGAARGREGAARGGRAPGRGAGAATAERWRR